MKQIRRRAFEVSDLHTYKKPETFNHGHIPGIENVKHPIQYPVEFSINQKLFHIWNRFVLTHMYYRGYGVFFFYISGIILRKNNKGKFDINEMKV